MQAIEARIDDILAGMSLEQKVGQMMQAEIKNVTPAEAASITSAPSLNGGGSFPGRDKNASVQDWLDLADSYYDASVASGVPIIWGTDAVHGHNNVKGATLFPHNIGLGATNNPDLIEENRCRHGARSARHGDRLDFCTDACCGAR